VSSSAAHLALIGRQLVGSAACRKRPHCGQFTAGSMVLSICVQIVMSPVRVPVSPSRKACKRRSLGTHVAGRQIGPDAPGGPFRAFSNGRATWVPRCTSGVHSPTTSRAKLVRCRSSSTATWMGAVGPFAAASRDARGAVAVVRGAFCLRSPRGALVGRHRSPGSKACHARTRGRRRALAEHPATRPG
jgi:hypothetical protein